MLHMLKKLHKENKNFLEISDALMAIPSHYADGASLGLDLQQRQELHQNCSESFCEFKKCKSPEEQAKFLPMKDGYHVDGDFAKHSVLEQVK